MPSGDTPTTIATPALSTAKRDMVLYGVFSGNAISYTPLNGFSEGNDQQVGATATLATGDKVAAGSSETPAADADAAPRRQAIAGLVLNFPVASAAVSGTITSAATEADVAAGDKGIGKDSARSRLSFGLLSRNRVGRAAAQPSLGRRQQRPSLFIGGVER